MSADELDFDSSTEEYSRPRRTRKRKVSPGVLIAVGLLALVALVAVVVAVRRGDRPTAPDAPVAGKNSATDPKVPATPNTPKAQTGEWSEVRTATRKQADAIGLGGKAAQLNIKSEMSSRLAIKLGGMDQIDRANGVEAVKLVKQFGVNGVPVSTLKAAENLAPVTVALMRIGTPPPVNTAAILESVCEGFSEWQALAIPVSVSSTDAKNSTDADLHEKGIALALFDAANPRAVSDFRRLQTAGLAEFAYAQAVESGLVISGDKPPAWFVKRQKGGQATSLKAEMDLLLFIWATAGTLPEEYRPKFSQELSAVLGNPGTGTRQVVQAAAGCLSR